MSKDSKKRDTAHIQSVENAFKLLEFLAKKERGMKLAEIAESLSWPKSTAFGYISSFRDCQYIDQSNDTGCYRLGKRMYEMCTTVSCEQDIRDIAAPELLELNVRLDEIIHLATVSDGEVLYIEKLGSTDMLNIVSEVGAKLPMHCTGLGKVMLAHRKSTEAKSIIEKHGLQSKTSRTINEVKTLEREMKSILRQGYAIDDGEIMDNLRCVAAPIYDRYGNVDYAISVAGSAGELQGDRLDFVRKELLQTAEVISFKMGFRKTTLPS